MLWVITNSQNGPSASGKNSKINRSNYNILGPIYFWVEPGCSFYHLTVLLCPCQVHKASWHMWHYGGKTPKPHYAFANSRHIARLNAGKLKGWAKHKKTMEEQGESHKLVEKYTDSEGRHRWKGTSKLRGSELGPQLSQETFSPQFLHGHHLTSHLGETSATKKIYTP
jgi:hypothetical protein